METTFVKVGNYRFKITDNTLTYDEHILSRNFKIRGNISDCINISISYINNTPVKASLTTFEHGHGVVIMMQTLMQHIHKILPELTEINFEDKSSIDCEINKSLKGTKVYPVPLYYFSIAFNGQTWYEKHFQARLKDPERHFEYQTQVQFLLNSTELKSNMTFVEFLEIVKPTTLDYLTKLKTYYENANANTFGIFFQSIPKCERCIITREWIGNFMSHYLQNVFSNTEWIIPIPVENNNIGGGKTKKKYYCPNKIIRHNVPFTNMGVVEYNI